MKILVTGCAGFIGYHLTKKILLNKKYKVFGIDNINNYYDIRLKKERLKILKENKSFKFFKIDLSNNNLLKSNFKKYRYNIVINLAAQAGVRFSIKNSKSYFDSNILGFYNLIELSKTIKVKHFIFASTSSVYGNSKKFPLLESFETDKPLSFYAASKKCNEVMAYSYSNIFKLPCTGLRFFTVYGPYGRPDMSLFKFTKSILKNDQLELYNNGHHIRDFTYIDDVINYIDSLILNVPKKEIPYDVYNIGSDKPNKLKLFLNLIEKSLKLKAKIKYTKMQKGDVYKTHANISKIIKLTKIKPNTNLKTGIDNFINWYKIFYRSK